LSAEVPQQFPFSGTVAVVAPHMDDETLGCGRMMACHPTKHTVHVVFATDGARSPEQPGQAPSATLPAVRRDEALAALDSLGIPGRNAQFLDLPDGTLADRMIELSAVLLGILRALRPRWIFVPFRYDRHPDHVAVNTAVRALWQSGSLAGGIVEYFVYSQWRLLPGQDVRAYVPRRDAVYLPAGNGSDPKRRALACHRSQTTRYFDWQRRPVLTPELVDRVCAEPEVLLQYDPRRPGRLGLDRGRNWVPIAHWLEPRLKRWKDGVAGTLGR